MRLADAVAQLATAERLACWITAERKVVNIFTGVSTNPHDLTGRAVRAKGFALRVEFCLRHCLASCTTRRMDIGVYGVPALDSMF